jgi:hypothetical protein
LAIECSKNFIIWTEFLFYPFNVENLIDCWKIKCESAKHRFLLSSRYHYFFFFFNLEKILIFHNYIYSIKFNKILLNEILVFNMYNWNLFWWIFWSVIELFMPTLNLFILIFFFFLLIWSEFHPVVKVMEYNELFWFLTYENIQGWLDLILILSKIFYHIIMK